MLITLYNVLIVTDSPHYIIINLAKGKVTSNFSLEFSPYFKCCLVLRRGSPTAYITHLQQYIFLKMLDVSRDT